MKAYRPKRYQSGKTRFTSVWEQPTIYLSGWSRDLLEKLTVTQLVKKFPALYGNRRFITVFTTVRQWSLPLARWIQFTPRQTITVICIPILSSYLRLVRPIGLFPSGFPSKILYSFLISPMFATWPAHLILLHLISLIILSYIHEVRTV
jgi:hypothetical protein